MKKVSSTKDLPTWFKLENYDCIANLSNEKLLEQIGYRCFLLRNIESGATKESNFTIPSSQAEWSLINRGTVVITDVFIIDEDDEHGISPCMPSTQAVHPLPAYRAIYFVHQLIKDDRLIASKDKFKMLDFDLSTEDFDLAEPKGKHSIAHMAINLADNSDKVILADIKKLLPEWREALKVDEPNKNIYSKSSHYQKIVDYKIIPLLDLKIWSLLVRQKIPHRVLTVSLYPNGEKGETELKQTVLPFVDKVTSDNYRVL
ncbi:MAG: hypothetical protein ACI88H_001359 [Cocleimonas sp.]|jgi:hypothetical protein